MNTLIAFSALLSAAVAVPAIGYGVGPVGYGSVGSVGLGGIGSGYVGYGAGPALVSNKVISTPVLSAPVVSGYGLGLGSGLGYGSGLVNGGLGYGGYGAQSVSSSYNVGINHGIRQKGVLLGGYGKGY